MRYHDRFKTILLNKRFVHLSVRDEMEQQLLDREQVLLETRLQEQEGKGPKKTSIGLTLYETRKVNEQNLNEMRMRMHEHVTKKA